MGRWGYAARKRVRFTESDQVESRVDDNELHVTDPTANEGPSGPGGEKEDGDSH